MTTAQVIRHTRNECHAALGMHAYAQALTLYVRAGEGMPLILSVAYREAEAAAWYADRTA